MYVRDADCAFADGGGDALDRAVAHVAGGEHPGQTGLVWQWLAAARPGSIRVVGHVLPGEDEAPPVPRHGYPALHRLERAGLVAATWSQAAGRRRRVYQLTPAGRRALAAERGTWREFSATVTRLLEPAPNPAPS